MGTGTMPLAEVVVTHIDPSSGPNSGGTTIAIAGSGFEPDGGTQITFAGFPASHVQCLSDSQCVVISPWAGPSSAPQVVDVQATVRGLLGAPEALSSVTGQQDLFTFEAGPNCNATQVCNGLYLPQLVVSCPAEVAFYVSPWTANQELVAQTASYTAETATCGGVLAACNGDPTNGSCVSYSLQASTSLQCGVENFCFLCQMFSHGVCTLGPNPLCCTSICQDTLPAPTCP